MTQLYIHAANIHQGGGLTLMWTILKEQRAHMAVVQVDSRMPIPAQLPQTIQLRRILPTVFRRVSADWWLANRVGSGDIALCIGNLPPLFPLRGYAVVFLQNRYLVDDVSLNQFPLKDRLRLIFERLWLKTRMSNVDEFVVQTPSMKRLLEMRTDKPVRVLPFMVQSGEFSRKAGSRDVKGSAGVDFLYVASGESHKNHRRLIEAWRLLAQQGLFPSLRLTLDAATFPELCSWLREMISRHGLMIENLGRLPHEQVLAFYRQAHALIYPSTFESLGLPLIEARQAGLPILAAELDYVRDVIDPEESFDPSSSVSIARAVKRFLSAGEAPLPLLDTAGFLKQILERVEQGAPTHR